MSMMPPPPPPQPRLWVVPPPPLAPNIAATHTYGMGHNGGPPITDQSTDAQLAEFAATFRDDPLGFVMAAYPWGEPFLPDGTVNPLRNRTGPEPWQRRLLTKLGEHIKENDARISIGLDPLVWRSARSSGHGVGKSALVCWLIQFVMATRANARGTITANTQHQLEDKTWPELAKWHRMFLWQRWFTWTATTYYFNLSPAEQRKNYMMTAATVGEDNVEAFQGLHNADSSILMIFDEASGIHPKIWEAAVGATTDGEVFFLVFGNPTQPIGDFADCFDKNKDLYNTEFVDSRDVSHTNKEALKDIITMYGADSDEARVRVYGQFPHQAYNEFISKELVKAAQSRELFPDFGAALIMGVDVARFGGDEIVITYRQGRDARTRPRLVFKNLNSVRLAEIIVNEYKTHRPDAIVIEAPGGGEGVIDQLRHIHHLRIIEFWPGAPSNKPDTYYRKRDELWDLGRKWLTDEGCIDADDEFGRQLSGLQYGYDRFEQKLKMESKELYKSRTEEHSPDRADSFMLTFAANVLRRDQSYGTQQHDRNKSVTDYDEFGL